MSKTSIVRDWARRGARFGRVYLMIAGALSGSAVADVYLGLDGGLEGSATVDNTVYTAAQAGKWVKNNATQTIALETTTVRSGANAIRLNNSSTTGRRAWTPKLTVSSRTSSTTIQYWRRVANTTNGQEEQRGAEGGRA